MIKQIIGVAAAVSLALSTALHAGGVAPALQDAMAVNDSVNDISVIIKFSDQLDIRALRKEFRQTLKQKYKDPIERKKNRKALKRAMMADGMKSKANRPKRLVRKLLKSYGENRKIKSLWITNSIAVSVPAYLIDELAALPGVESVVLDAVIQGPGTGTAPTAPSNWNLNVVGAPGLWAQGHTGQGVVVATLDTGVDATHPDLGPRWRGGTNSWLDPYGQHTSPADSNGHGTQVLGLIVGGEAGGYQIGMAPEAQWIAAKIFDDNNDATLSGIHQAYQWVFDPDGDPTTDDAPDIVNNSWALSSTINQCNQEFAQDIALLKEAEILVLFSGGNYGPNADTSVSPANDPAVVSVGAIDFTLNVDNASSRGAGACDGGIYPHLVAPGVSVLTADRMPLFYNVVSGTSFSVAHLSGGMALLRSAFPDATLTELEAAVIDSAADLGIPGADDDYGYGLLDVEAAFNLLGSNTGNPGPGDLQLSASAYSVDENVASISVTVTRSGGSSGAVSVDYATSDGSAISGEDYQATTGTLNFADGEVSRNFSVSLLDDTVYEGNESFTVTLSNPLGGSALGITVNADVTILDNELQPGQVDSDGDGVTADLDCNDNDNTIYPGAMEIKHDGVDQDCNGYDLTIDITEAVYWGSADGLQILATSDLGQQAQLNAVIGLAGGGSVTLSLKWNSTQGRWQKWIKDFSLLYGATPVSVVVTGIEGSESTPLEVHLPPLPVDNDGDGVTDNLDCNDNDNTIYPGATEIKHDAVDQDCNGYDLTIDITLARYWVSSDGFNIRATSDLGQQAQLQAVIGLADGSSVTLSMKWNSTQGRWQKWLNNFSTLYGAAPVSVTVTGIEGSESTPVVER